MPVLGLVAWAGGLAAVLGGWRVVAGLTAVCLVLAHRRVSRAGAAAGLVFLAVAAAGLLRESQVTSDPVAQLAAERAVVSADAVVTSDPRAIRGDYGDGVMLRASVRSVTGRGATYVLRSPVLVLAGGDWDAVPLGATIRFTGRLSEPDSGDLSAVVSAVGGPTAIAAPGPWWQAADAVRESLRDAVAHRSAAQRALVPALVVGDDARVDPALAEDFRTTGLTHLLAVSGTNLTLVVGFLLVTGRWCGVRGRWHYLVGTVGICGFVLIARTEPSVVRAAAMGTVALLGMGVDGRRRGTRALGVALVVLLLVDPRLAVSVGFALSVVATAGILLLAPGMRDAMARWLPRWGAEAVAVPLAAQLSCTPLVAAISGQVSLVAVAANLAVAPVIGPATVLGLAGGLAGLAWDVPGRWCGTLAAWCVAWLVAVAERGAALPAAAIGWGTGAAALGLLTLLTVALALALPRLLRRPAGGIACGCLLALVVLVRLPSPGWPPSGWVLAVCDVGQGDALAVRTGPGSAVVVDTGPDPGPVDRCLDRLGIERVPLLVLTHDHADHVDGIGGVRAGRRVGEVVTGDGATYGDTMVVGDATLQVLWPPPGLVTDNPNDASVVLLVAVAGVRFLLTGDVEPPSQAALDRAWPGLSVDVVKLPHHGSRHQDLDWLLGLGARVAVASVGESNDYGHPAAATLEPFRQAGVEVLRTDTDGDVVVAVTDGELRVATSG